MTDVYGAVSVPLAASTAGEDPFLTYVLSFLKAVGNAYAIAEWNVVAPALRTPNNPIAVTFDHDPGEAVFTERDLPALFLYRSKVTARTDVAQDIRVESGELSLLWVPPPAPQDRRRTRFQFAGKLLKVLDTYLERGRDPAWCVDGDTDTDAAPHLDETLTTGSTPPAASFSGTPALTTYFFRVAITTGGARGAALFKWSIDDGVTWVALGVTTAATVALGATGITVTFPVGTYATNNVYRCRAQGFGSVLATYAKFRRLRLGSTEPRPLIIEVDGTDPRRYLAYVTTCPYEEELTPDLTRYDLLDGVDQTLSAPDDDPDLPNELELVTGALETES